jgi:hypothetical protein
MGDSPPGAFLLLIQGAAQRVAIQGHQHPVSASPFLAEVRPADLLQFVYIIDLRHDLPKGMGDLLKSLLSIHMCYPKNKEYPVFKTVRERLINV